MISTVKTAAVSAILLLGAGFATAQQPENPLYSASVIVTGDREETRIPMIPQAFAVATAKLSGNPDIVENPAFAAVAAKSRDYVWSYTYHDRMFGRPIHDEQGTRDRPFDLTVQFDQKMLDAALKSLGEKPWPEPRPHLGVILAVTDMARSYLLTEGGEHGADQRAAFADASTRYAIPVSFPTEVDLATAGIGTGSLDNASFETLELLRGKLHVDALLLGHLEWNKTELGWTGTWRVPQKLDLGSWNIHGVNFDAAFRDAVGGAAKRLRR